MKSQQPVTDLPPSIKRPVAGQIKDTHAWSFSFKYYNQADLFGLDGVQSKWFVSLLERFKQLSKINVHDFIRDISIKRANRYHEIDWEHRNIPIQRKNLYWVDENIINNEEDYPFFQFQLSTGLGRIVGFWHEDYQCFYIVLLDPKHNLQPSKKFDYRVDKTAILTCEYTSLLADIDRIKGIKCVGDDCRCKIELCSLPTRLNKGTFVYFQLDDEYYQEFIRRTERLSIKEIIELGLLSF